MESLVLLLLVLTLHVAHAASSKLQPSVELVSGHTRIFSGESVRLRCNIRDPNGFTWTILWFWDSQRMMRSVDPLYLRKVSLKASGKYSCQGVRSTLIGNVYTEESPSLEIHVDGGWAILQGPQNLSVVGSTVEIDCYLRDIPKVRQVILYRDGVEVMRNGPLDRHFILTNVSLADRGHYSCRASWEIRKQTYSVISAPTYVEVLEVLTEPFLEMVMDGPDNKMKLICHAQYHTVATAHPVSYFFYHDKNQVAPSSSLNHIQVRRLPGMYSCKVRVPQLGLVRLSSARKYS